MHNEYEITFVPVENPRCTGCIMLDADRMCLLNSACIVEPGRSWLCELLPSRFNQYRLVHRLTGQEVIPEDLVNEAKRSQ